MEKKSNGVRVILFPLPLQGCINPMLQLANILHSRGFSITVIHTRFNAPRASNHPLFTFLQIPDGLSESQIKDEPTSNVMSLLAQINVNAESPFRECLQKLLLEESERVSCLIDDCGWLFTQSVAESLNLPRLVLSTFKATLLNAYPILPRIRTKGYLPVSGKIVKWAPQLDVLAHRATGGFLTHNGWNSTLESICEGVPMISLPFVWDQLLNARFVSDVWRIGIHLEGRIERREIESAVIRLMVEPEGEQIRERVNALRDEVRRSVQRGGSSSRRKASMEKSNGLRVVLFPLPIQDCINPMFQLAKILQSRGFSITLLNARFVSDVWMVGLHLEGRIERNEIERVVRKLLLEPEGEVIRERMKLLGEKVGRSVKQNGSAYRSLEHLVDHISSL
ncbi:hypothetical protein DY000_02019695 [Brassica cretica]|uniref:Glycosyltransferase n=1 Tax=Brassica cretica TaxID=69181 RepID=A0ABQ7CUC1_BRACR|nr:hypothetical protein DY000_02019695 [Brassica cretica]